MARTECAFPYCFDKSVAMLPHITVVILWGIVKILVAVALPTACFGEWEELCA